MIDDYTCVRRREPTNEDRRMKRVIQHRLESKSVNRGNEVVEAKAVIWIPSDSGIKPVAIETAVSPDMIFNASEDLGRDRVNRWHAQAGQDRSVAALLGGKRGGFFIDLAANEPVILSNRWLLESNIVSFCLHLLNSAFSLAEPSREILTSRASVLRRILTTGIHWRRCQ